MSDTPALIERERSCLMVVDVQTRLLPVMDAPAQVVSGCALLLEAASVLGIPSIATEQYPAGLGPTVDRLGERLAEEAVFGKIQFSAVRNPAIRGKVETLGRDTLVICGIEAHVCVLQTAMGFAAEGYRCCVVADATSSRLASNHAAAMARLRAAGIWVVTTEMVAFEWLAEAGTPEFRQLIRLIK